MRSICHLSRRWHQQFCLSPNFSGHQKCIQQWQPIRQYRQSPPRKPQPPIFTPNSKVRVREFEQYGDDPSTRMLEGTNPIAIEAQAVKAKLDRLEKELEAMKQGPFGPSSEFMRSLPVDEREELLKVIEAQGIGSTEIEDLFTEEDLERFAEEEDEDSSKPLAVTLRIPAQHKAYVRQFNKALQDAQGSPDNLRYHLALWKWYLRCQQKVQTFSAFVSEDVWSFLWESQQKTYPRSKHLVMLAKDMINAEIALEPLQLVGYIEALHYTDNTATAIRLWEENKSTMPDEGEMGQQFWTLGIELYSAVGRPNKAQEIAFQCSDKNIVDATAFVPVMKAWAVSQKPAAANRLWYVYLRLREKYPGRLFPTDVLGQISTILLEAGQQDMAITVFKDMVLSGDQEQMNSVETYTSMLKQFSDVNKANVTEDTVNRIGLSALLAFPRRLKNKYFFGAWIKWLIGDGKVDDAALVVELMHEHGVRADARHLNGIIGAWLRSGTPSARAKAEELAWAMIQSRIKMVDGRTSSDGLSSSPAEPLAGPDGPSDLPRQLPRFLRRDVPPATIETFSVLLLRYTRQSNIKEAEHLTEVMVGPAQLKPNCFILNHWLYLSLRQSDLSAMWSRYCGLRDEIEPDLETFAALWDGLKRNLDRTQPAHTSEYPDARQLFAEMQKWLATLDAKKRKAAEEAFSHELYEQIIRCFCLSTDLHGTFIALRELRDAFQTLPHDNVARMVLMQVARMLPAHFRLASKPRRAAVKRRDSAYRAALSHLANVMESITENKMAILFKQGVEPEEIDDREGPAAQALRLDVICTFLCMVLKRQLAPTGNLKNDLILAAGNMRVSLNENDLQLYLDEAAAQRSVMGAEPEASRDDATSG